MSVAILWISRFQKKKLIIFPYFSNPKPNFFAGFSCLLAKEIIFTFIRKAKKRKRCRRKKKIDEKKKILKGLSVCSWFERESNVISTYCQLLKWNTKYFLLTKTDKYRRVKKKKKNWSGGERVDAVRTTDKYYEGLVDSMKWNMQQRRFSTVC